MNAKTPRILFLLALGLFAYIFLFERKLPDARQRTKQEALLFPGFQSGQVASLDIILPTNQLVRFEQTNEQWRLTWPLDYPAQATSVQGLLNAFGSLRQQTYISPQEILSQTRGLAAFGLEPPRATLILQQTGARTELRIGGTTHGGRFFYAQRLGADGIDVCDAAFLARLPRTVDDWRSRLLIQTGGGPFDRFEVRVGALAQEFQLDPTNRLWRLARPKQMRANHPRVENLVHLLRNAEVTQFVTDLPNAALELFGLQPPRIELLLSRGTNELLSVRFGSSPTNDPAQVYARLSTRSNVVLVPKSLTDILGVPYKEFLDPYLIAFETAKVDRLEVKASEVFNLRREAGGRWRVPGADNLELDAGLMHEFLDRLNRLEVVDVEKDVVTDLDFPKYGFSATNGLYTLQQTLTNVATGTTNATLAQIAFGSNRADRVFVRRSDETPVYVTRLEDWLGLPQAAFQLRERRLWSLKTNDITGLTIMIGGQSYRFARGPAGEWSGASTNVLAVPLALPELVQRLSEFQAEQWLARDSLARFGFKEAAHQLALDVNLAGKSSRWVLDFGRQSPLLTPFAATILAGASEPTAFTFRFWFYEPYREVLRELNLLSRANAP